jgi:A/G-specific adenine glycosylase
VDAVVVDANVERVLSRLFDIDAPVKSPWAAGHIRHLAGRLTPSGRARDAVQALMEFGARVCRPRNPACAGCPLAGDCQALRLGITEHRPVPGKARAATPLDIVAGILFHQGRVFIQKRPEHLVWGGLWEFPGGRVEPGEEPAAACVREFAEETELAVTVLAPVAVIRHAYTTYRVRLHGFTCALAGTVTRPVLHAALECRWVGFQDLADHPFPAAHRKLADALARKGVPG